MPPAIREDVVQSVVAMLRDKTEVQREDFLRLPILGADEKEEVRKRLWASLTSPAPPKTPEEREEKRKQWRENGVFQRLVQDARRGRAILFIGAGVSLDVNMPSSAALTDTLKQFAQSYGVATSADKDYRLDEIADLLQGVGLRGRMLEELADRIQTATVGPDKPYQKGFYRLLPYLGEINRLIVTTNWDDLMERAFEGAGEPYVTIRRDQDVPLVAAEPHAILKLHGDFTDPKTVVVSGTDYALARNAILQASVLAGSLWGAAASLLAQRSFIFVGYRLADSDMNLIRTLISARHLGSDSRHYMVGKFDDRETQGLQDWANMEVIQATASEFFVALAQELAEFANRRDDLERIFRLEAAPFLEFYAPFGAGKRALCDEIERRAQGEGWKPEEIVRVDLGPKEADLKTTLPPLTHPELVRIVAKAMNKRWISQGEKLREALEEKRRLLVIFEHTEAVEAGWPAFVNFVSEIPAQVISKLTKDGKRSRLILAGRYPVAGWPFSFKREAEIFPLSPFSLSGVSEMVGKYTLFNDPEAAIEPPSPTLVRQIYDLTGRSNPGFIKHILDDLLAKRDSDGKLKLPPELSDSQSRAYLASFMDVIRKEIWSRAPAGLETLFAEGLCVLRRLNASLLYKLADEDVFRDHFIPLGGPQDVIAALRQCHLLAHKFPLYEVDPVVRHIHSDALRKNTAARLGLSHRAAARAWRSLLPSVRDTEQLMFFQEWLYHAASYLVLNDPSQEGRWSELQTEVATIEFLTTQVPPVGMGEALLREIGEKPQRDKDRDGELLDVLVAAIGETHYEDLHQALVTKPEAGI